MLLRFGRSTQKTLLALGLGGASLLTAGCGIDSSIQPAAQTSLITGVIHGGPNPVVGATVKLMASASNGYGGAGTTLATTTSGQFGQFSFDPTKYTCPAGQYVYATAAAGNTGANTVNANSLLVSVVGLCGSLSATTPVFLSEATTVATSYALSNFISVTGTGAGMTVNISAPPANNATTLAPACTGTGTALTCTAAGLRHAFQNAINIADTTGANSAAPFFATTPSNSGGTIPQALLNTIADAVQSCVNSSGGAAGDSPADNCGTLFTNTTPPATSTTTAITPTNTVQALVNLAKYPTMTPAQVTAIYTLAGTMGFFQPNLTAAPTDFSLAIVYKGAGSLAASLGYPYFLTLDYADNVYSADNVTSSTGPVSVASLASNGAPQFVGANITTALCAASSACLLATGLDGHVWLPNYNTTANRNVYEVSTTDGSLTNTFSLGATATPYAASVDRFNSVFVTSSTAATANLFQSTVGSGGVTFGNVMIGGAAITETLAPEQLAFDGAGNLWNINYTSTSTGTSYFANSGTTATTLAAPVTSSESATVAPYSILIDGGNNGWVNTTKTLYEVPAGGATTPTVTATISYTSPTGTTTAASSARYGALDGLGNIFLPDNNTTSSKVWQYFPGTNSFVYLFPCSTPGGATTCGTTATTVALYGPRNAQADSTGSLWVESSTSGAIVQIIGTANPTWPLLALGKPGQRPQ